MKKTHYKTKGRLQINQKTGNYILPKSAEGLLVTDNRTGDTTLYIKTNRGWVSHWTDTDSWQWQGLPKNHLGLGCPDRVDITEITDITQDISEADWTELAKQYDEYIRYCPRAERARDIDDFLKNHTYRSDMWQTSAMREIAKANKEKWGWQK